MVIISWEKRESVNYRPDITEYIYFFRLFEVGSHRSLGNYQSQTENFGKREEEQGECKTLSNQLFPILLFPKKVDCPGVRQISF